MSNQTKTVLLLSVLSAIIMAFGSAVGGQKGLMIAFVVAMAMNVGSYWFSSKIVLAMTKAQVVDRNSAPDLFALVEQLAQNAGLPMPQVAIVNDPAPNAFATGRNPANGVVAVTTGLLNLMDTNELAGVLAHELAHIKHRDILIGSIAATMASVIMLLANLAKYAGLLGGNNQQGKGVNPIAMLLLAILAPLAASIIQAAISRSREYMADQDGANIAGSPNGLASALHKLGTAPRGPVNASPSAAHMYISNPLSSQKIMNLFSTHPPLEDRIAKLRTMTLK